MSKNRQRKETKEESDPLSAILRELRLQKSFFCRTELVSPWGLFFSEREHAQFHFVAEGTVIYASQGEEEVLEEGDMILLLHGKPHRLMDRQGRTCHDTRKLPHVMLGAHAAILQHSNVEGGVTQKNDALVLCGGFVFEEVGTQLAERLPHILLLRKEEHRLEGWWRQVLQMMNQEAQRCRPGGATILSRLAELLISQVLREWLERQDEESAGLHQALRHPQIGQALSLLHTQPGHTWTVASLASAVGMSRAVFSERFGALVQDTPIHYLAKQRMLMAVQWLREGDGSLMEIAERLGYQSEAAFSRAFKRHVGTPPGEFRERALRSAH